MSFFLSEPLFDRNLGCWRNDPKYHSVAPLSYSCCDPFLLFYFTPPFFLSSLPSVCLSVCLSVHTWKWHKYSVLYKTLKKVFWILPAGKYQKEFTANLFTLFHIWIKWKFSTLALWDLEIRVIQYEQEFEYKYNFWIFNPVMFAEPLLFPVAQYPHESHWVFFFPTVPEGNWSWTSSRSWYFAKIPQNYWKWQVNFLLVAYLLFLFILHFVQSRITTMIPVFLAFFQSCKRVMLHW